MKRVTCSLLLVLSVSGISRPAGAENPAAIATSEDARKQRETLNRILEIGTAAFAWLTDTIGDDPNLESGRSIASEEGAAIDWAKCSDIAVPDLVALLVPAYLSEVPALDGWGKPLQFCLNRPNLLKPSYVLGIRSAGRDGRFGPAAFRRAAFEPTDWDHDIAWLDGYFVAWPEGGEPKPRSLPAQFTPPPSPGNRQFGVAVSPPSQPGWKLVKSGEGEARFQKEDAAELAVAGSRKLGEAEFGGGGDLVVRLEAWKQSQLAAIPGLRQDSLHFYRVEFKERTCLHYDGSFEGSHPEGRFTRLNFLGYLCPLGDPEGTVVEIEVSNRSKQKGFPDELIRASREFFESAVFTPTE